MRLWGWQVCGCGAVRRRVRGAALDFVRALPSYACVETATERQKQLDVALASLELMMMYLRGAAV